MRTILILACILPIFSLGQQKIDKRYFEDLLNRKLYDRVFVEGNDLLKKPYGKTSYLTYYYIGRSLCGRGYTSQGKEWYQYIKEKLQIDPDFRRELNYAESNCTSNVSYTPSRVVNVVINTSYTPVQPGGIRGKGGFVLGCRQDVNENYENLRKNDSLDQRIFSGNEKEAAIRKLRTFLSSDYAIDTSGRFIVVTLANMAYYHDQVVTVTKKLEFAYQYYITKYHLQVPDKLYTVYLLPDRYNLGRAAKDVHDIRISEANIGYSSLNDLSLLGISNPGSVGTLFHELFHLTIRSDVGDISPWLDEGMACLYSVYSINNNELIGSYNTWRITHFKLLVNLKPSERVTVPSLEQLINFNWEEYQGGIKGNLCIASVHYALSNMFALYLQYKKLLPDVIETFKNKQNFTTDSLLPGPNDTKLIEMVFHKSITEVSADFYKWLKDKYNIDMINLLQQRPSYYLSDLPANFQPLFDSSNILLSQIESAANLVTTQDLTKLKVEQKNLFDAVVSIQRSFTDYQREMLDEVAATDMSASVNNNYDNDFETRMKQKEAQVIAFNDRLKSILSKN
jgi:hypothetical protein